MRVVAGESVWDRMQALSVAGEVARANAEVDRFYRLGALAYQAALVDRVCERERVARRLRRRCAAARRIGALKWAVECWFAAQDEALRREYGIGGR